MISGLCSLRNGFYCTGLYVCLQKTKTLIEDRERGPKENTVRTSKINRCHLQGPCSGMRDFRWCLIHDLINFTSFRKSSESPRMNSVDIPVFTP